MHVSVSPCVLVNWSSTTATFANFTGGAHTKHGRTYFMNGDLPPKCHIKDFAKKPGAAVGAADGYLLALFCEGQPHGHNGAVFLSGDIHTAGSFHLDPLSRFNFTTPNFHDHDVQPPVSPTFHLERTAYGMEGSCVDQDIHLIHQGEQWIDYQISFRKLSMLLFRLYACR